jgi:hypothetical protein
VGRSADPRRTAEARIRGRGVNSFEVHDQAPWTAIAELADISGNHADAIAAMRGSNPDLRAAVLDVGEIHLYPTGGVAKCATSPGMCAGTRMS